MGNAGAVALAALLGANKTVEELDLSGNEIGDEGVVALAGLLEKGTLKVLNIEGNKVGDTGIAALCRGVSVSGVPVLKFTNNNVGDAGAAAIGELVKNSTSILEVRVVCEKGCVCFSLLLNIVEQVQLGKNHVTDKGVETLCNALKSNKSVLKLDLSENVVGPAGVAALHELLKTNRVIGSIDVSGNAEIVEGKALASALQYDGLTLASLTFSRYGL